MKKTIFKRTPLIAAIIVVACSMISSQNASAADHIDAPSILIDGRMDINDIYLFQSPSTPNTTVMAMTVNPLAGILSPSTFNPNVAYDFAIDRDGNAIPDFTIRVRFSQINRFLGTQFVVVRYIFGNQDVMAAVGQTGQDIPLKGGGVLRAGTFDDPFFFDFLGFRDGLNFTGFDFFQGFNVSAIVIDYPRARLGGTNISLVGRTLVNGIQQDRTGRPAVNTALIPGNRKDEFNLSPTHLDQVRFGTTVEDSIESLSGSRPYAEMVTMMLLPDVLTFNQTSSSGFLNGRKLDDDVIDAVLNLVSNGGVTGDGADANDVPFLNTFPYLAPAH